MSLQAFLNFLQLVLVIFLFVLFCFSPRLTHKKANLGLRHKVVTFGSQKDGAGGLQMKGQP